MHQEREKPKSAAKKCNCRGHIEIDIWEENIREEAARKSLIWYMIRRYWRLI